jgi:hypothetical protein
MVAPNDPETERRFPLLRGLLRWLVAGGVGALASLALFVGMGWLLDTSHLMDRLFRVFPLKQTVLDADEACGDTPLLRAVTIEGVVGTLRAGRLQPLVDAEVRSDGPGSGTRPVEVSGDGGFRLVAAFPDDRPSPCDTGARSATAPVQHLIVRAPGCSERRVPITRAWVPHAVLLECPDRR